MGRDDNDVDEVSQTPPSDDLSFSEAIAEQENAEQENAEQEDAEQEVAEPDA